MMKLIKNHISLILLMGITSVAIAQSSQTRYFNDRYLNKEVKMEKAKYTETTTKNPDGTVTTDIRNAKKDELIRSETYKGDEPYGVWKFEKGSNRCDLDYNFNLIYSDTSCNGSESKIQNFFVNDESVGYKAPAIASGEPSIIEYLVNSLYYPSKGLKEGISGKVILAFTITKNGTIENLCVKKGVHFVLDKEAARVIHILKLSSPPTLNGKPVCVCVTLPVRFTLN